MTTWLNVKNNAESALASAITATATTLTLAAGDGAKFPLTNFNISIDAEILTCSSRSGDVLTVSRAQEGTAAAPHASGAIVALNVTAAVITQLQTAVDAGGAGAGDMLKSVYDTDNDGVVDNAEKLEGSTKLQVQDHAPKAHASTHQNAGADEINVAGLSGELADRQKSKCGDSTLGWTADKLLKGAGAGNPPVEIDVPGGSGSTTFLGLTDTPDSYVGQSGKAVQVKTTEDGLEFVTPGGAGTGDMLKSVYDTDNDGVVDNAEKLEGSTKLQVQDHAPKAHASTHQNAGADELSLAGLDGEPSTLTTHKDLTTGVHGAGANYIAQAPASGHLVRSFTKGWTSGKLLKGAGVDTNPTEIASTKMEDADGDTKVDVEESADEDKIRMDVKGVEAYLLDDAGVLTLAKQSAVIAYANTAQSIPNNEHTKLQLSTEVKDTQGEYDPTTNFRYTAKKAGIYLVIFGVVYNLVTAAGTYNCTLRKNGTAVTVFSLYSTANTYPAPHGSILVDLAVNDYLEVYTYQNSGASQNIYIVEQATKICIIKLA